MSANLIPLTEKIALIDRGGCPVAPASAAWFLIDGPLLPLASGMVVCVSVNRSDDGSIECEVQIEHRGTVYDCDWQTVFVEAPTD